MPFDPQLIHPDDPPLRADGELDLPADLAALAEQLGDDAAHLAACYPADGTPQVALAAELVQSASRLKRLQWFRSAAMIGAGLATVAVLGVSLFLAARQSPEPVVRGGPVAIAPAATGERSLSVGNTTIDPLPATPFSATPFPATPFPATATLSVGELSGPELEALLDLLNGEPQSVASISF
jgi:hypothetical protein